MAKITWEQVWKWIERVQTFKWLVGLVVAGGMMTFITTVLQVLGYVSGPWLIVLACGIFALVLSGPVFAVERGWIAPKRQNKTTMATQKESTATFLITDVRIAKRHLYRLNRKVSQTQLQVGTAG